MKEVKENNNIHEMLKRGYPWLWVVYIVLVIMILIQTIKTGNYYLERTNILAWLLTIVVAVIPNYFGFIKYIKSKKTTSVFVAVPVSILVLAIHAVASFFLEKAYCGDDGVCGLGALGAVYVALIATVIGLFIGLGLSLLHKKLATRKK